MVYDWHVERFERLLSRIPRRLALCHGVAKALIATGQQWHRPAGFLALFVSTDYTRQRRRVRRKCRYLILLARRIRRARPSIDTIRASIYLDAVEKACRDCPSTNKSNLQFERPFVCLAQAHARKTHPRRRPSPADLENGCEPYDSTA